MGRPKLVDLEELNKRIQANPQISNAQLGRDLKVSAEAVRKNRILLEEPSLVSGDKKIERPAVKTWKDYTFTDHMRELMKVFELAQQAEQLDEENNRLKNRLAAVENALKVIQREVDKVTQSEKEYDLLIKQGKINKPLVSSHNIYGVRPSDIKKFIAKYGLLDNIISEGSFYLS